MRLEDSSVIVSSQLFGGKIMTDVRLAEGRGIISIYPGSFPMDAGRSKAQGQCRGISTVADRKTMQIQ